MSTPRKSSRRQFLTGQALVSAAADLVDSSPEAAARRRKSGLLLEVGRRLMACEFHVYLNAAEQTGAADQAVAALDLVERLEDQLTVYREHSEVSRINRYAHQQPQLIEARLCQLLALGLKLHAETGGAFDMTAGPISKLWGFYRREGRVPAEDEIELVRHRVGSEHVTLDPATQTIQFHRPAMELNLGGIGKGYALDRCVELLAAHNVENFLIHGGQSSIIARGSRAGLAEGESGWIVALRHPLRDDIRLGEMWLRNAALGSSGSAHQFFYHQGRRYSHILDPRTGRPAEGMLSTTVIAPTGAEADALATAFFVMGIDATLDYCAARPDLAAILIAGGQRAGGLEVVTTGPLDGIWQPYGERNA